MDIIVGGITLSLGKRYGETHSRTLVIHSAASTSFSDEFVAQASNRDEGELCNKTTKVRESIALTLSKSRLYLNLLHGYNIFIRFINICLTTCTLSGVACAMCSVPADRASKDYRGVIKRHKILRNERATTPFLH